MKDKKTGGRGATLKLWSRLLAWFDAMELAEHVKGHAWVRKGEASPWWQWARKHPWQVFAVLGLVIAGCVVFWPMVGGFLRSTGGGEPAEVANHEIIRNLGLMLAAFIGVGFAWWRSVCLGKQTRVAEQGLITDRFIKTTEQLGNENESVRIGAIYSLWRIALDSPSQNDKRAVLDVLCAFVRTPYDPARKPARESKKVEDPAAENGSDSKGKDGAEQEPSEEKTREDIQIAMNLLGYRMKEVNLETEYILDLTGAVLPRAGLADAKLNKAWLAGANLRGAHLAGADLEEAHLQKANLQGANLAGADLAWASLTGANLEGANLAGAHLEWASLDDASLKEADLTGAHLNKAFFFQACLSGANLQGANLQGAHLTGADLRNAVFDKDTNFSNADLRFARFSSREELERARHDGAKLGGAIFEDERETPPEDEA